MYKIIVESKKIDRKLHLRTLCVIFYEIDKEKYQVLSIIHKRQRLSIRELISLYNSRFTERQKKERIYRWTALLEQVGLIRRYTKDTLSINNEKYIQALKDSRLRDDTINIFKEYLVMIEIEGLNNE